MPYELGRRIRELRSSLPTAEHPVPARYGVAALCAAGAVALRAGAEPFTGPYHPFLLFVPAVFAASRYGGFGPGALCTALSGAASYGLAARHTPEFYMGLGMFGLIALLICWSNEALRRAARVLGEALEQTDQILESISDGFYAVGKDFRFTYVNATAEALWGKRREELLGRVIWEAFPQAVGSDSYLAHLAAAQDRLPRRLETFSPVLRTWLDLSIHPSGEGLSVYFHDISERRRRRKEMEQLVEKSTSRLKEVNEELETFTYSASHDLRGPARKIRGYSDLLRRRLGAGLGEEGKRYLDLIQDSTGRLVQVIDEMKNLAEASQKELRPERVDLSAVAERCCRARSDAEPRRRVSCRVQPGLSATGDPALLEAALCHLLDNAFKFTRGRKHALVEFGAIDSEGGPVFFVRDDGAGFDMRHARKLFRPFERLHDTGEFPGAGVGLAIVQRIIRRHGGEVWAEAKPGEGAVFYFTLPEAA
jgi:PAS domain S-box-containing protein